MNGGDWKKGVAAVDKVWGRVERSPLWTWQRLRHQTHRRLPTLSCRALTWSRLTSASPLPCLPLPPLSSVDAAITPVCGRLTCALEMDVYEGPFDPLGRRHDDGATCAPMDGRAKFMGWYHAGNMLSGTLVVAGEAMFVCGERNAGG